SDSANCLNDSDTACFLYKVTMGGTTSASTPGYCSSLGCTTTDGSVTVKAVRGPLTYKRKLRTVAGGEDAIIPYARVHTDADEATFCPGTGQVNALGSRADIGIDNDV